jgi:hypothetical protein
VVSFGELDTTCFSRCAAAQRAMLRRRSVVAQPNLQPAFRPSVYGQFASVNHWGKESRGISRGAVVDHGLKAGPAV